MLLTLMLSCSTSPSSVTENPCAGLGQTLSPPLVMVAVGEQVQVRFQGSASGCTSASYQPGEPLAWAVADTTIAVVSSMGEVLGRRAGSTTLRAAVVRTPVLIETGTVVVQ